ncbi:hypothetical protein [Adhaeribacter arboris]|uniref:hypothetical protein n=1 Tax=Adhaeribacter arboris TaxID=2072846 RepID=UPI0013050215|nr:hypothetical protein [Adhaeribacter arboris]
MSKTKSAVYNKTLAELASILDTNLKADLSEASIASCLQKWDLNKIDQHATRSNEAIK